MTPATRMVYQVAIGELRGGEWDWGSFSWRKPPKLVGEVNLL